MKEKKTLDQKIELAKEELKEFDKKKKTKRKKFLDKIKKLENKKRDQIIEQFDGMSIEEISKAVGLAKKQK